MEPVSWSHVFSIVATLFGILASCLLGIATAQLTTLRSDLKEYNTRLSSHIENKDLHYAAIARTDEQVHSLANSVKAAHERIDRVEVRINHG